MNFNTNFLKYRKQKGFTQEELAEKLQVSRQSISKWENGDVVPDLTKVIKIAEILEVSMDELCGTEFVHKIETQQNINSNQNIQLELKNNPLRMILAAIIIAILCGIGGFFIGQSSVSSALPNTMNVSNLDFSMNTGILTCRFVPETYSDDLSYNVVLIDAEGKQKSITATFENGIGCANIVPPHEGSYQVVLQISDAKESRSIVLEDDLYVNREEDMVNFD